MPIISYVLSLSVFLRLCCLCPWSCPCTAISGLSLHRGSVVCLCYQSPPPERRLQFPATRGLVGCRPSATLTQPRSRISNIVVCHHCLVNIFGWTWKVIRHHDDIDVACVMGVLFKGLIMDGCVLLTSTPECVVSPRGETTHEGVDVNNTHPSMINPDYNMILANLTLNYQYFAY